MITKVLEYMTCFCGDKLEQKSKNEGNRIDFDDSKIEENNKDKERTLELIQLIIENYFPKKKRNSNKNLWNRMYQIVPKIEINNVQSKIVYDSDTEIFKNSEERIKYVRRKFEEN